MLKLDKVYKESLIKIIKWNLDTYCAESGKVDEFKIRLKRLLDEIYSSNKENNFLEIDKIYIVFLKEAIENAKISNEDHDIPLTDIETLWKWIYPIYTKK